MGFDTDKEDHGYIPDYLRITQGLRPDATVCEVGVLQGGSLAMWQQLFPGGLVIGVDRNPASSWPNGTARVIAEQDDPQLRDLVAAHAPHGCDLIVDDASHIGHLSSATLDLLWPLVRPGGFYVVEDWADPWVSPHLMRWPDVDPKYAGDELVDFVPSLITMLKDGAVTVTYTRAGLVVLQREGA